MPTTNARAACNRTSRCTRPPKVIDRREPEALDGLEGVDGRLDEVRPLGGEGVIT
ncbi:MAG: hypothetical protein NVS3B20_26830 [Polyangiales bacterium]